MTARGEGGGTERPPPSRKSLTSCIRGRPQALPLSDINSLPSRRTCLVGGLGLPPWTSRQMHAQRESCRCWTDVVWQFRWARAARDNCRLQEVGCSFCICLADFMSNELFTKV